MTKVEFVLALNNELSGLTKKEKEEAIKFYVEIIEDKIEQGYTEEAAINSLGDISIIAKNIIKEKNQNKQEDMKSIVMNVYNETKSEFKKATVEFNKSNLLIKIIVILILLLIVSRVIRVLRPFVPIVVVGLIIYLIVEDKNSKKFKEIDHRGE